MNEKLYSKIHSFHSTAHHNVLLSKIIRLEHI